MTTDTVTIVRCRPPLVLAKRVSPGRIQACDRAKSFDLFAVAVDGLGDIEDRLRELLTHPDCAVVRGEIADPARVRGVQRLLYADPKSGAPASLKAQPRSWLALDFDGVSAAPDLDLADLAACGKHVRTLLPPAFHSASCVVQATASHLIAPGLHLRSWFWLSRPTSEAELKVWLKGCPVDPSVFSAVQLIYSAKPIFEGDHRDPLPERLAVLFGAVDAVSVPERAALIPPQRHYRAPPAFGSIRASAHASLILSQVAAAVLRAPEGQRHKTLVIGARRLSELEDAGLLSPEESDALLTRAARGAGFAEDRIADVSRILTWARHNTEGEPSS